MLYLLMDLKKYDQVYCPHLLRVDQFQFYNLEK